MVENQDVEQKTFHIAAAVETKRVEGLVIDHTGRDAPGAALYIHVRFFFFQKCVDQSETQLQYFQGFRRLNCNIEVIMFHCG